MTSDTDDFMVRRSLEKFICQYDSLIGIPRKNSSTLCVILYSNTLGDETSAGG